MNKKKLEGIFIILEQRIKEERAPFKELAEVELLLARVINALLEEPECEHEFADCCLKCGKESE